MRSRQDGWNTAWANLAGPLRKRGLPSGRIALAFAMVLGFALAHGVAVASPLAEIFDTTISETEIQQVVAESDELYERMAKVRGMEHLAQSPGPYDFPTTTTLNANFIYAWADRQITEQLDKPSIDPSEDEISSTREEIEKRGVLPAEKDKEIEFSRVFLESVKRVSKNEDQSEEALIELFAEFENRFPARPPRPDLTAESWLMMVRLHLLDGVTIGKLLTTNEELDAWYGEFTKDFLKKRMLPERMIAEGRLLESRKLIMDTKRILASTPGLNLDPESDDDVRKALRTMLLNRERDRWTARILRDHLVVHDPDTAAEVEGLIRNLEHRANLLDNYVGVLD